MAELAGDSRYEHNAHHQQATHHHYKSAGHHHTNPATSEDVKAGRTTADHIEKAVKDHDPKAYDSAMKEVNDYRAAHKNSSTYTHTITGKLEKDGTLPDVALFEAKNDLSKQPGKPLELGDAPWATKPQNPVQEKLLKQALNMADPEHTGSLTAARVQAAQDALEAKRKSDSFDTLDRKAGKDGETALDKFKKDKELQDDKGHIDPSQIDAKLKFDKSLTADERKALQALKALSTEDKPDALKGIERKVGLASTPTTNDQIDATRASRVAMEHLFDHKPGQQSLYDRLDKDKDGNINPGAIRSLLGTNLSADDRKSLDYLQSQRSTYSKWLPKSFDMTAGEMRELSKKTGIVSAPYGRPEPPPATVVDSHPNPAIPYAQSR